MGKTTNLNEKMLAPIKAIPLQTLGKSSPQDSDEDQIKKLVLLLDFVNTQRENGSNHAPEHKLHPPSYKELMIQFLEDYGTEKLFYELSKSDVEYYSELDLEAPADIFTDVKKWANSDKYDYFLKNVWSYYNQFLEALFSNPDESLYTFWQPANLWQKYTLESQLLQDNPTAGLIGLSGFLPSLVGLGELKAELVSYCESNYGFHCMPLLEDLTTGFYYLVRRIKEARDKHQKALQNAVEKGIWGTPKLEKVFRVCKANAKVKDVKKKEKKKKNCGQFIIIAKDELIFLKLRENRKGKTREFCSKACNRRYNQNQANLRKRHN